MEEGFPVPDPLNDSLAALQDIGSCKVVENWQWRGAVNRWALRLCITRKGPSTRYVPSVTDWFFLCEPIYPWGDVTVYPAKQGGLTATFPHQRPNVAGSDEQPWRAGNLCLEDSVRILGRQGGTLNEPVGQTDRLGWRVLRLEEWLRRAARGELLAEGDPFELPDYSPSTTVFAFNEDPATYAEWQSHQDTLRGTVEIARGSERWCCATQFASEQHRTVVEPSWGLAIKEQQATSTGIWMRLDDVPHLRPWQAPKTWGELRQACSEQGVDLDATLFPLLKHARKSPIPLLLLGFPVPLDVGSAPDRLHWLAVRLSLAHKPVKGFRPNEEGFLRFDRQNSLANDRQLEWLNAQNWSTDQISTRGRLVSELISQPILLVGAGALGSALGELLVRGGATDVTVMDKDRLEAGNLVRHTSDLRSVGANKADDLALRLNAMSPHANAVGIGSAFPNFAAKEKERVDRCTVVIDTTAEDDVLEEMDSYTWNSRKLFVSVSLGRKARHLFCFTVSASSFSHRDFRSAIGPWLTQEAMEAEMAGEDPVWMGIGCWHPIFPASVDDVRLMAAVAIKELQRVASTLPNEPCLSVWEQVEDVDGFSALKRADLETDEERPNE